MRRNLYGIEMVRPLAMIVVVAWYSLYVIILLAGRLKSGNGLLSVQVSTLRICLSNRNLTPLKQNVYIANYVFLNQHQYPLPGGVPGFGTGKIRDIHKVLDKVYKD